MVVAIVSSWFSAFVCDNGVWLTWLALVPGVAIGVFMAFKVTMIQMPQLVGLLNAFGGLASAVEAVGLFLDKSASEKRYLDWNGERNVIRTETGNWNDGKKYLSVQSAALHLALIIGSITFFGSIVACLKLMGKIRKNFIPPYRQVVSLTLLLGSVACSVVAEESYGYGTEEAGSVIFLLLAFVLAAAWGILFVLAIGGADMPVVICILNTGSGAAGVFAGFMLGNKLLVITGTFVASSGAILSALMCIAMNRNLLSVLNGGFGEGSAKGPQMKIEGTTSFSFKSRKFRSFTVM